MHIHILQTERGLAKQELQSVGKLTIQGINYQINVKPEQLAATACLSLSRHNDSTQCNGILLLINYYCRTVRNIMLGRRDVFND